MIQLLCDYMKKKIFISSFIFLIVDILSKVIVRNTLTLNESISLIPNFFNLTYVINSGAAFSILEGKQLFLIILSIFVLGFLIYYIRKEKVTIFQVFYYSLLISGILGNLLDRIIYNGVIDFFSFQLFSYNVPIFNIADTYIVIGVGLIFIELIRKEIYGNKSNRE